MQPYDHYLATKAADQQQGGGFGPAVVGAGAGAAAGYAAHAVVSKPGVAAAEGAAKAAPGAAAKGMDLVKRVAQHAVPIAMSLLARRQMGKMKMPGSPGMARPAAPAAVASPHPTTMGHAQVQTPAAMPHALGHAGVAQTGPMPATPSLKIAALAVHEAIVAAIEKIAGGTIDPDHPEAVPFMAEVARAMKTAAEERFADTPVWEKAATMQLLAPMLDGIDFLELSAYPALAKRANVLAGPSLAARSLAAYGRGYDEDGRPVEVSDGASVKQLAAAAAGATAGYGLGLAAERAAGGVAPRAVLPAMGMIAGGAAGYKLGE